MSHNNNLSKLTKVPICSDASLGKIDKIATGYNHSLVLFENGMLYGIEIKNF